MAMTEPWTRRCPQGHTTIYNRSIGGFRCRSCGGVYIGDPIDAREVDSWPADDREPVDTGTVEPRDLLAEIVAVCDRDTRTRLKSRELPWGISRIADQLHDLAEAGLVERVDCQDADWWSPTEDGRQLVSGLDDGQPAQATVFGLVSLFWLLVLIGLVAMGVVL